MIFLGVFDLEFLSFLGAQKKSQRKSVLWACHRCVPFVARPPWMKVDVLRCAPCVKVCPTVVRVARLSTI